jgi:LmbE family N-acetylglucosaminyl deacetylase
MAEPLTLLAVHAHPDDESSSTGGVLARCADEGIRTVVVTCTNGEFGDAPGGVKPGEPGHDEAAVAATRLAELDKACEILGVDVLEKLGYHDSGMAEWEYRNRPDAFCNVPVEESTARVVELLERYRPQVVLTYNEFGGYEHPDHIQASRIARLAVERTGIPAKLYFTAFRMSEMQRLRARMEELGFDVGPPREFPADLLEKMRAVEAQITTTIDVSSVADRKREALRAHASQLAESWFATMPPEVYGEFFQVETFMRAADRTGAPLPETDLFAGLR